MQVLLDQVLLRHEESWLAAARQRVSKVVQVHAGLLLILLGRGSCLMLLLNLLLLLLNGYLMVLLQLLDLLVSESTNVLS